MVSYWLDLSVGCQIAAFMTCVKCTLLLTMRLSESVGVEMWFGFYSASIRRAVTGKFVGMLVLFDLWLQCEDLRCPTVCPHLCLGYGYRNVPQTKALQRLHRVGATGAWKLVAFQLQQVCVHSLCYCVAAWVWSMSKVVWEISSVPTFQLHNVDQGTFEVLLMRLPFLKSCSYLL